MKFLPSFYSLKFSRNLLSTHAHECIYIIAMHLEPWQWTSIILCGYGLFKEFRPSEPFFVSYLLDYKDVTSDQVYYTSKTNYKIYQLKKLYRTIYFFANLVGTQGISLVYLHLSCNFSCRFSTD